MKIMYFADLYDEYVYEVGPIDYRHIIYNCNESDWLVPGTEID